MKRFLGVLSWCFKTPLKNKDTDEKATSFTFYAILDSCNCEITKPHTDIEKMAKLRNEFSEVTRVKIEFSYDNPEVTIVPIPEGATADANSAAPTESAPVESSN
jgi:hypothetical protein